MAVTKEQQDMIRGWGLIELAEERLARCRSNSDLPGIAYNERKIARYKKMLQEKPIPNPPPIPRAIP